MSHWHHAHVDRAASVDCGALYLRVHREFAQLLASLPPAQLDVVVPAAPQWCVRDVAAHVVGLSAALNAQQFPDADDEGGTEWAASHIAERADASVPELLAEWDREAPAFAEGLRLFGYEFGCHFLADLLVHLHDVQAALGLPPYLDPVALAVALDHYCNHLGGLLGAAGWGMVAIDDLAGEVRSVGVGVQRARVSGSAYDVLRTISARRSERQVRSLAWAGDVDAFVAFLRDCWSGGYSLPLADQP